MIPNIVYAARSAFSLTSMESVRSNLRSSVASWRYSRSSAASSRALAKRWSRIRSPCTSTARRASSAGRSVSCSHAKSDGSAPGSHGVSAAARYQASREARSRRRSMPPSVARAPSA